MNDAKAGLKQIGMATSGRSTVLRLNVAEFRQTQRNDNGEKRERKIVKVDVSHRSQSKQSVQRPATCKEYANLSISRRALRTSLKITAPLK